jgi:hypothetical protein
MVHTPWREGRREFDALVAALLDAVSFDAGQPPCLDRLRGIFLPQALLIAMGPQGPEVQTLEAFIAHRRRHAATGTTSSYRVVELSDTTELFGGLAQRASAVRRVWTEGGRRVEQRGMLFLQGVRTAEGWRLSAAAWRDPQGDEPLGSHPEPTEFG